MRPAGRVVGLAAVLVLAAGCSSGGAKKSQLSGKVTFKGKPVPAGFITFQADQGQVQSAPIKDGIYDTSQGPNPGIFPGSTTVRITGFDGKPRPYYPQGHQIFNPYELKDTIPEGTSTKDFDVPAAAANNLRIEPTADIP
jgi:hypothetical protein